MPGSGTGNPAGFWERSRGDENPNRAIPGLRTVADGFPIEWMDSLGIPTLLAKNPDLAKKALFIHEYAVWALMLLIAAHVGVALMHTVIKKDGEMQRMWPPY